MYFAADLGGKGPYLLIIGVCALAHPLQNSSNLISCKGENCEQSDQSCSENEVLMRCRTCEATCENQKPDCPLSCHPGGPGCECPHSKGFVRHANKCISAKECPSFGEKSTSPAAEATTVIAPKNQSCSENEVLMECRTCEANCENQKPDCPLSCHPGGPGCECPHSKGFVRHGEKCIPVAECPSYKEGTTRRIVNASTSTVLKNCDTMKCPTLQFCRMKEIACLTKECPPEPECVGLFDIILP